MAGRGASPRRSRGRGQRPRRRPRARCAARRRATRGGARAAPPGRGRVDVAALAGACAEAWGPAARAYGRRLEPAGGEGVSAGADELRVLEMGRIVGENALLHTPKGAPVRVRAAARGDHAVLEVE